MESRSFDRWLSFVESEFPKKKKAKKQVEISQIAPPTDKHVLQKV
jgi:hypothetical protein